MPISVWTDRERVEEFINNNPGLATDLLASSLDQASVDTLYAQMFPPATAYQKRIALTQARRLLMRNGSAKDGLAIKEIEAELAIAQSEIDATP